MTLREFHVRAGCLAAMLAGGLQVAAAFANAPTFGDLRLIMVEQAGCPYCLRWDREIGSVYGASPEGQAAPLNRLPREAPELAKFKPVIYTPTFILARGDHEIGRITGYPGESYYWEELGVLFKDAGIALKPADRPGH